MAIELRRCPFCGSNVVMQGGHLQIGSCDYQYVQCADCEAEGPHMVTRNLARTAWNLRIAGRPMQEVCAAWEEMRTEENNATE